MSNTAPMPDLGTLENFAKHTVRLRKLNQAAGIFLGLAIAVFIVKVIDFFGKISTAPRSNWSRVYFSYLAVDDAFATIIGLIGLVVPPLFALIALILWIIARITSRDHTAALFESFQQRGYVAAGASAGFSITYGRVSSPIVVLSQPSMNADTFAAHVHEVRTALSQTDKKTWAGLVKALQKESLTGRVVPARFIGGVAPDVILAPANNSRYFVVIPQDPVLGNGADPTVLRVKE